MRQPDEDYASYLQRVANSSIWDSSVTDTAVYDLDVDGAAVLNGYAKAQDDIYYFSVACSDTYRVPNYQTVDKPMLLTYETEQRGARGARPPRFQYIVAENCLKSVSFLDSFLFAQQTNWRRFQGVDTLSTP